MTSTSQTPADYCKQKTRASGSSFAYAFGFLSKDQCRAMMALYAFCREVDDIADELDDKQQAAHQIGEWHDEISRVFEGNPSHPVGHELYWAKQHFAWDKELFFEMLDGMLTDISGRAFIKESDLSLYCYRVAGVVGLLCIEIFGYQHRKTRHFASTLGEALQLTNILRDIREDAGRDRIYLPQSTRARFKVSDQDIYDGNMPKLQPLLAYYGEKAEATYTQALARLPLEDRVAMRPAIIMAAIYYTQLKRIKAFHYDIWQHTGRLPSWRKLIIAWKAWRYEKQYEKSQNTEKYPLTLDF